MGRNGHEAEGAFKALRLSSQAENRKLRDVAADVVRESTGARDGST